MAVNIFNVSAFFIVLREVLEACLVVGIVLAYLNKSGATHLKRWVWIGAAAGVIISFIFGLAFAIVFYVRKDQLFTGRAEKIFEGITFLIAAALLTWMILWMAKMGRDLQRVMEQQVEQIIERESKSSKWGIFFMVFIQVLREGIETWIFLVGAAQAAGDKESWRGIPLPGILGILVGLLVSYLLFKGMVQLSIEQFFITSSFILMAFSAGLVSHAFHELQEADWFGTWKVKPPATREWWNATLWSTKSCCNDKENQFFALLRALFGYQDTPTFVEISTYFAYWLLILAILIVFNWGKVRSARSTISKHSKRLLPVSLLFTFVGFIFAVSNPSWNGILTMTVAFVLSITGTLVLFRFFSQKLRLPRRILAIATGIGFGVLTAFMLCLHIAQMACDEGSCSLPKFYYFGLIFGEKWVTQGRAADNTSWASIGVLSVSLVISVFFFGGISFAMILFGMNVDRSGQYEGENIAIEKVADEAEAHSTSNEEETAQSLEQKV